MEKLRICAISDTHGFLPEIEPCEILFICGDISPLNIQSNMIQMNEWIFDQFLNWIKSLPVKKVLLIAGNHDFFFEGIAESDIINFEALTDFKLLYLCNESFSYITSSGRKISVFGTPYCHQFGNWAFMRDDDFMTEKFKEIPDKVDFILSHDTPYNVFMQDVILGKPYVLGRPDHVGNQPLRKRIQEIDYKWLFHGHIHSSAHTPDRFGTGNVINVSLLNEFYQPTYKPFYLELDE